MTICVAIKCKEKVKDKTYNSILFAADTQSSSSYIKRQATKLRVLQGALPEKGDIKTWKVIVASSGDAYVAYEAINNIQHLLYRNIPYDELNVQAKVYAYLEEIGNEAHKVYKKYKDRGDESPEFELLLGVADEFTAIYHITPMGKVYEAEDYDIIGSGAVTGGELLIKEFLNSEPSEDEVAALAALIVSEVGKVDMYVGGDPKILMVRDRRSWEYNEKAYKGLCEKAKLRWNLLTKIWKQTHENTDLYNQIEEMLSK